jgi:hypothetical protein
MLRGLLLFSIEIIHRFSQWKYIPQKYSVVFNKRPIVQFLVFVSCFPEMVHN